jgi:CubicO group peptidase (beta-lactamase class C family)
MFGLPMRFCLGYRLNKPAAPYGPNPHAFGHPGAGGSLGYAEPDAKLGFGYTMNKMGLYILIDPRARLSKPPTHRSEALANIRR